MTEETLFHQALEKPPGERVAFLDRACPADSALRRRVEVLLRAHDRPGSFLQQPAAVDPTTVAPQDAPADRPPPALPGDYEIVRELGRGGMGVVYLARQKSLGRDVAVKVLRPGEATFGPLVKRFLEEARHLARLRHPNIVSIHEIGQADGEPYFTMDFVEGEPLSALLARSTGRLPPTQALGVLKQVAAGVQHAHEHGIIHRDLKPGNVLVDAAGHAYVTDFGLARDLGRNSKLTRSGEIMGTPAYMSPEQARGQKELIGEATDVHALGVLLYEMLTGQLPYGGGAPADVIVRLVTDEPTPPRKIDRRIPRDLETICLKAMAKAPDRRYGSVRAFLEDVRRFESGEPVLARRPGPLYRATRLARRHWKLGAAVLLTAAAVLAVAPRLFEKSVEELVKWGNEERAAGQSVPALRLYARAYRKADHEQRRGILETILTCARGLNDQKQVGEALQDIVDVDPDVSFQEFDYAVGEAWGVRLARTRDLAGASPEEKRRLLELGEKRILLAAGGGHLTPQQEKEIGKQLAVCRMGLAMLQTAPDLVFEDFPKGEPDELLRRATDKKAGAWQRGLAAFSAGFQLEHSGKKEQALAAYRRAFEPMRVACPTYAGLSRGIDMNLPRDKQHECKEPRLLRELGRAIRRLDPGAPDPLRGGVRFRVVGPQIPKNEVVKLCAALWDSSVRPIDASFGSQWRDGGAVPRPPGSFPIGIDGTAWVGVADGKYRLAVWRAEWGATRKSPSETHRVELDFRDLPKEVEIAGGQTVEVPIRSHELKDVVLQSPAAGASLDLRSAVFRWSAVPGAAYYFIHLGHDYPIVGGRRADDIYGANVGATTFSTADIPPAGVAKFAALKRGTSGVWQVSAHDATGRMIGRSSRDGSFRVARELDEK